MRVTTEKHSSCDAEKKKRYGVGRVEVRLTFSQDGNEYVKQLTRSFWQPRRRSEVTAEWVQDAVDQMLERSPLDESWQLTDVVVEECTRIWSTPLRERRDA